MYSDKQKNEFAWLRDESASFNSVCNKINDTGFSSIDSAASLKIKINIHNELYKYQDKIDFFRSAKNSQTVAPNDILKDVFNEYKPVKRIPFHLIKCHSFVIFLSIFLKNMLLYYQVLIISHMTFL